MEIEYKWKWRRLETGQHKTGGDQPAFPLWAEKCETSTAKWHREYSSLSIYYFFCATVDSLGGIYFKNIFVIFEKFQNSGKLKAQNC